MSDLMKCILCLALVAGGWFVSDYSSRQGRRLDSAAAHKLVMVQGNPPATDTGRPVLLEFWGTYCGPCLASIPHLNQLHAKFGPRVQFVAVSSEDFQVVKAFMTQTKLSYPVAVDPTHEFFEAWKIKGVPTLIYLDANQKEQWRGHSMEMTDEKLAGLLGK